MFFDTARKPAKAKPVTFPAPRRGWIKNSALVQSPLDAAEVLDNIFPTAQGARLRKGSAKVATLDAACVSLMGYINGATTERFAATATDIYDITSPADADVAETPVASGFGSGDWSSQAFTTAAGAFLWAVNGTDYGQIYNGTDWLPVTGASQNDLDYDGLTAEFVIGETVTGGTSGASATIVGISKTSSTAGTLRLGAVTSGPFQDNEALTSASGAAVADGANASGSTLAVTGVATTALSQVWTFKNRLWFVEENTTSAWYLGANAISGAATEFPLRGIFNEGGNLLFGATWSLDSGDGIDDVIVFVSDQGEIAVYQGTDPSSDFALSGVYKIGKPLNKRCSFRAGGDLAIATEEGIVSVAEALRKDRAALAASALTFPIEDAWQEAVANRTGSFPISVTLWSRATMLVVGTPATSAGQRVCYVANVRTGAWCRFTGWDVRCALVSDDRFFFGTAAGTVVEGETGGNDQSAFYAGTWVPKFQEGDPSQKVANLVRFRGRAAETYEIGLAVFADYAPGSVTAPASTSADNTNVWGTGLWGTMIWGGGGDRTHISEWQPAFNSGVALAPAFAVQVNRADDPTLEVIALDVMVERGRVL